MKPIELINPKTRPKLYFNPEDIIQKSFIEPSFFWQYLEENFLDFFSDISEVSNTLEYFTLSDTMDNIKLQDHFHDIDYYSSSLSGRAVLNFNCHPAPPRFRNLSVPTYTKIYKKVEEKKDQIMMDFYKPNGISWQIHAIEVFYYKNRIIEKVRQEQADENALWEELRFSIDSVIKS